MRLFIFQNLGLVYGQSGTEIHIHIHYLIENIQDYQIVVGIFYDISSWPQPVNLAYSL